MIILDTLLSDEKYTKSAVLEIYLFLKMNSNIIFLYIRKPLQVLCDIPMEEESFQVLEVSKDIDNYLCCPMNGTMDAP